MADNSASESAERMDSPRTESEKTDGEREEHPSETEAFDESRGTSRTPGASIQRSAEGYVGRKKRDGMASNGTRVDYDPGPDHQLLSARYGLDFVKKGQATKIQRLEDEFGSNRVKGWVEEGMTIKAMGKPRDMQAFRERQERRPNEVPTDVERQNKASVQRSSDAVHEDGRAGDAGVPNTVREVVSSPGQSLDESIQREMEAKMGNDFSDVRVHTGPRAAAAAEAINARAFTVGNHVAFNRGEYQPSTDDGKRVLAHELTHVRQQTDGAVSLLPKKAGEGQLDSSPQLEREAEKTAQRVVTGGELGIQRMRGVPVHVQRASWEKQQRDDEGKFGELKEDSVRLDDSDATYGYDNRPSFRSGMKEQVWEEAKNVRGMVICPETDKRLTWDKDKKRNDQWHMGHKPGREYRYLVEYYLRGIISHKEFLDEYNTPKHYRPEHPDASRSGEHEGEGEYWERKWGPLKREKNSNDG